MRRGGLWGLLLIFGVAASLPAEAAPRRGSITYIQNRVEVKKVRAGSWQKAQLRSLLTVGDAVRTGPGSRADLTFTDGSMTRLGSNGWITIQDREAKGINLMFGKLWLKIRKGTGGIRVRTPSAVAAVTGTEFMIEVTPDQTTNVTVLEGSVEVTGQIEGSLVNLVAGTTTSVTPNQSPAPPVQVDIREIRQQQDLVPDEDPGDTANHNPDTHNGNPDNPDTHNPDNGNPDGNNTASNPDGNTNPDGNNTANPEAATLPAEETKLLDRTVVIENPRPADLSPTTGDLEVIIK